MTWFWRIVFFSMVAVGLYAWLGKRNAEQQRLARGQEMADFFARQTLDFKDDSAVVEKNFFRALSFAHQYHDPKPPLHIGTPPDNGWRPLLEKTLTERSYDQDEIGLIVDSLEKGLAVCSQYRIWDDPASIDSLDGGTSPTIESGTFAGERLRIAYRISPVIAPQARNHPANFRLVPASVWALQPDRLDLDSYRFSDRLHAARILDGDAKAAIATRWDAIQKKNS